MDGGGSIEGSGSGVSVGSGSTGVPVGEVLGDCSVGPGEVDGAADVDDGLCVGDGVAVAVGSGVGVAEADGEGDGSALSEGSGLSDGGGLGGADADGVGSGASLDGGAGSEGSAVGAIHEDAVRVREERLSTRTPAGGSWATTVPVSVVAPSSSWIRTRSSGALSAS